MEQRQPSRLARPYVLDATTEHPAQLEPATWPVVTRSGGEQPVVEDPGAPADAPTSPAVEAGHPPAAGRRPPASHHLWTHRYRARRAEAATRGRAEHPLAALFGAHGTTATFVVIVIGVAATVLAVAAMKGRTPPQPAATSWGGVVSPEPGADASYDRGVPPVPSGNPLVPGDPGVVLPDVGVPTGVLPPVGNAAGAPAGNPPAGVIPDVGPLPPAPGAVTPGAHPTTTPTGAPPTVPNRPATTPPAPKEPVKGTAYRTIQGESFDGQDGVKIESAETGGGRHVGFISTGDWVRYDGVTFTGDTARGLRVRASNGARQNRVGTVELRLDSRSNAPIGRVTIPNNGLDKWFDFSTYSMSISPTTGTHTVYLTFTSGQSEEFANVDWLTFTP